MSEMVQGVQRRSRGATNAELDNLPVIAIDLPALYEDEGREEMGDTDFHSFSVTILHGGVRDHLGDESGHYVFTNLNLYYHPIKRKSYVSPDIFVVKPSKLAAAGSIVSDREGRPGPLLAIEVMSKRSGQQQDLGEKLNVYHYLKVPEYILADVTGEFLPQKLLLKRRQPNGRWKDEQDADGGVTSALGFRVIIDTDGDFRLLDAATGKRYPRPQEVRKEHEGRLRAEEALLQEAEARLRAEEARRHEVNARRQTDEALQLEKQRVKELEAELARLRRQQKNRPNA